MDPNSGSLKRYTVEGTGNDGEDGAYITVDYVMAESETGAAEIVERARQKGDGWTASLSETFKDHIWRERERLDRMAAMTPEEIEAGWAETKASLGDDEDEPGDDAELAELGRAGD